MAARFGTVDGDLLLHNQTDSNSTTGFYEGTTGYYEGMFTVFSSINVPKIFYLHNNAKSTTLYICNDRHNIIIIG